MFIGQAHRADLEHRLLNTERLPKQKPTGTVFKLAYLMKKNGYYVSKQSNVLLLKQTGGQTFLQIKKFQYISNIIKSVAIHTISCPGPCVTIGEDSNNGQTNDLYGQ